MANEPRPYEFQALRLLRSPADWAPAGDQTHAATGGMQKSGDWLKNRTPIPSYLHRPEDLALPDIDVRHRRLTAPTRLSKPAQAVFADLVASVAADHFTAADAPLLEQYAVAVVQARDAADALARDGAVINGKASPWLIAQEKAVRAMTALALRLRVSPQSRFDRLKAGTSARRTGARGVAALMELDND